MKSVIDLCNDNTNSQSKGKPTVGTNQYNNVVMIEHLPMSELYAMIEQHKLNMQFLKDDAVLSGDKKMSNINKIKHIFAIVEGRSVVKNK